MKVSRSLTIQGVPVPAFFYGTAWKEDRTEELVKLALTSGFAAIDTANQRRHYVEPAVGAAVVGRKREELFLQTKFTYAGGQDHRIPYDPRADPATQVRQSFESSLEHLQTTYVDSYILHGPSARHGLSETDEQVWRTMQALHGAGKARLIGASNVSLDQLIDLHRLDGTKPAFVQNRCFATTLWDGEVREFCRAHGIAYQGFSLLTANAQEIQKSAIDRIAQRAGRTCAQVVFRFALQAGMIPLTGTSSAAHMREDLGAFDFELTDAEAQAVERVGWFSGQPPTPRL
jgi:diketogulonate reductase-like aldo/keto reductase